jgi:hypothetical protein
MLGIDFLQNGADPGRIYLGTAPEYVRSRSTARMIIGIIIITRNDPYKNA